MAAPRKSTSRKARRERREARCRRAFDVRATEIAAGAEPEWKQHLRAALDRRHRIWGAEQHLPSAATMSGPQIDLYYQAGRVEVGVQSGVYLRHAPPAE